MRKFDRKYFIILGILIVLISLFNNNIINIGNKNQINDYYDYINKKELESIKLDDDKTAFTRFDDIQEKVDDEVKEISNNIRNNNSNADKLYNLYLSDERNNLGISPLNSYLNRVDNCNDINTFTRVVTDIESELYMNIFMNVSVSPDMKDNSKNIVYFESLKFDFEVDPYIYSDPNYSSYAAYIKQGQLRLLKLYGYDKNKARDISTKLFDMEKDISTKSKSLKELTDYARMYNKISKEELNEIYSNLDVDYYLDKKGISNQDYYSIVDKDSYKAFNEYLTNDNLDLLKEFVKIRIIESYSSYLSDDYAFVVFDINNKMTGVSKEFNSSDIADTLVSNVYSDVIESEYVNRHKSDEKEKYLNELFNDIRNYYKKEIKNIDWMSSGTKKSAIKKLDKMKINVSNFNYDITSNSYFISDSGLINNIINMKRINYNHMLDILNSNSKESIYSETLVNAFYNPQDNSINFPTAFLEFIDLDRNYYENLGIVGMIVGHEVTHSIDSNGAMFDYNGNLNDWWTKKDYKEFNKLTSKVVDYYSKYEISGINVDGEFTLGENIADLGAIRCISGIAKEKGATKSEMKKMYKGFAKTFIVKVNPLMEKMLMSMDNHSPNKVRVNATLSSTDEFYETYNIKKSSDMYVDTKDRVKVW